ncbi:unnamed protein product [Heligmosomoides polygyrus]|uniref:Transposase n=1 Tax=Heligmosomoides polygyrus TaxID=6339 RepID=A0A183FMR2_HELPZ|nr:unnamed protein product [Heligmosomoides polygyrus]
MAADLGGFSFYHMNYARKKPCISERIDIVAWMDVFAGSRASCVAVEAVAESGHRAHSCQLWLPAAVAFAASS